MLTFASVSRKNCTFVLHILRMRPTKSKLKRIKMVTIRFTEAERELLTRFFGDGKVGLNLRLLGLQKCLRANVEEQRRIKQQTQ